MSASVISKQRVLRKRNRILKHIDRPLSPYVGIRLENRGEIMISDKYTKGAVYGLTYAQL